MPPYVVDFYREAARLIIELDGSQHSAPVDATRSRKLQQQGMQILRF